MKQKLLVICGLNATGKSDIAVEIAKKFDGEIISADSRQVYKGLDIGSGKDISGIFNLQFTIYNPLRSEASEFSNTNFQIGYFKVKREKIWLLDIVSPNYRFNVVDYARCAKVTIEDIKKRGKLPIICGGTGFYIQAITNGLILPEVLPDMALRNRLSKLETNTLYDMLRKMDPLRAKIIDKKNPHRLIRAIEIIEKTGKPVPVLKKRLSGYDVLFIGLKTSMKMMRERIIRRLEKWLEQGLVDEVANLRKQGISWRRLEEFGLEYRLVALYLQKKINFAEMKERMGKDITDYAKRQMTWFKKDKRIKWFDISEEKWKEKVEEEVEKWYNTKNPKSQIQNPK